MGDDDILRSMRNASDEELLAITSGAEMGYTDWARSVAEAVLRERRVALPADLRELRKRAAASEAEAARLNADRQAATDRALGRKLGAKLLIVGVGGFILPFFGVQFHVLKPLGLAMPIGAGILAIIGYILMESTGPRESQTNRDTEH